VYLEDALTDTDIEQIGETLAELAHVREIEYRSREDALQILQKTQPDFNVTDLGSDFLPVSYVVSADHPKNIENLVARIRNVPGVDTLRYGSEMVSNFLKIAMILVGICIVTIVLLLVFTSSSISNIIGLSIYARRTEIRIMQLVGATWWFIRWPFIFEGVFFGIVGAVIASLIISALMATLAEALRLTELTLVLPYISLDTKGIYLSLVVLLIGLGALVGFYGSLRTVNAFLGRESEIQLDALRVRRLVR
jgi:cell division transport system permease protein